MIIPWVKINMSTTELDFIFKTLEQSLQKLKLILAILLLLESNWASGPRLVALWISVKSTVPLQSHLCKCEWSACAKKIDVCCAKTGSLWPKENLYSLAGTDLALRRTWEGKGKDHLRTIGKCAECHYLFSEKAWWWQTNAFT